MIDIHFYVKSGKWWKKWNNKNLLRTNDPSSVQRVLLRIFKSPPPINPLGFEKIIAYKTAEA